MNSFSQITPYIEKMAKVSNESNHIVPEMYKEHNVFRGLRDTEGKGVVTGLTEISFIKSTVHPCRAKVSFPTAEST